ncbi:MAG TPA: ABC transporter permease subunit [Bacillota bacterium]|nr:ABC transporter permease subunit [Bacillota bacterium]
MFLFELKKLWRRKQFLIISVLVIVAVTALFYRNYWMQDEIREELFTILSYHSNNTLSLVEEYEDEMYYRSEAGTLDEAFIEKVDQVKLMSDGIRYLLRTIDNQEWDRIPEVEMIFLESVQKHIESGGEYREFTKEELAQRLEYNHILLEHSLPYEHDRYSISTTNFMKSVFGQLLSVQGLVVFVFLFGILFVMEKEHQTIRTLVTQPIPKSGLILGKFLGQMGIVMYTIILIALISYIIPLLFGGHKGSFLYPQLILYEDGFKHITLGNYLLLYILIFLGVSAFVFSVNLFFSTIFHDRLMVLFLSLTTFIGGIYVTNQFSAIQVKGNPFYYFTIDSIIENQQQIDSLLFMTVPYICAIFLLLLSILFQRYKQSASKGGRDLSPYGQGAVSKGKSILRNMFIFEGRKLRREGQVKRVTLILLLLIIGGYFIITLMTNKLQKDYISRIEDSIYFSEFLYERTVEDLEKSQALIEELQLKEELTALERHLLGEAEAVMNGAEQRLNLHGTELDEKKSILNSYENKDWTVVYNSWIDEITRWWKDPNYGDNLSTEKGGLSSFTYLASIEQYNWMKEHNLTPVLQGRTPPYIWTVHDKFLSPMEQLEWNRETRKFDNTGLFYIYTFLTTPSFLLFLAMLIFVLGVGMSAEKGSKRTLTFLKTQPITISSVYLSKTWLSIIVGILITLGSWVVMILLGTLFNRFGDLKYPILFYDPPSLVEQENYSGFVANEGGFHFITMGKYLLETGSLFLVGVIFLIALSLFLSLIFRQSMTVFVLTVIMSIGGYLVGSMTKFSSIAHFLPFTYLNVGKIANGELAIVLENEGITLAMGFVALLVGATLLILLGWLYSRSRWMRVE